MMTRMDVPVGTILDYAGTSVPAGYLECDGSAVSRSAYPLLFAAIGTTWGVGNGSTTFNLPNLNGRTCIGSGTRNVGATGGSETHALTLDEVPSHAHSVGAHAHTVPQHGHGFTQPTVNGGATTTGGGGGHGHEVQRQNNSGNWWFFRSGSEASGYGLTSTAGFANRVIIDSNGSSNNKRADRLYATAVGNHSHSQVAHTHSVNGGAVQDKAAFSTNNSTAFDSGSAGGGRIPQHHAALRHRQEGHTRRLGRRWRRWL